LTGDDHIDDALASELAQLVDGRLPADRRAALEDRVSREPWLASRLHEQEAAAERLAAAMAEVRAPASLRARMATTGAKRGTPPLRRRWPLAAGLAAAAAGIAVVLVLVVGGTAGAPSLAEAASLGLRPPDRPAPPPAGATLLRADQDGVPFPRWGAKFGWVAVGERKGTVKGRSATTVYYRNPRTGARAAYTILGGHALKDPEGAPESDIKGTDFYLPTVNGRRIVTWQRQGHTCVLQGTAPALKLLQLASWRGNGTIPF
jgi:hypothetical protein